MKSISITKSVLLLVLFTTIACNGNSKNSKESEVQATDLLAENETGLPNVRYEGEYTYSSEEEETFGNVSVRHKEGNIISFELFIEMGGNSGELSGEVEIVDGKGVFKNDEYGDCILDFVFTDNSVKISHQEGGYGCGFGMNVAVNNTFLKKSTETSSLPAGKITEDLLWEIFLKIPEGNVHNNLFVTKKERQQARVDKLFEVQGEDSDNLLEYDHYNGEGVKNFMGIACYPTDDEKKIITLFYVGGGLDIYTTPFVQTYEYDIATGIIKPNNNLIEPYTEDDFFDKSILSPEQLKKLQASYRSQENKELLHYIEIKKSGFGVYFMALHAFNDDWDEYTEYCDLVKDSYIVKYNWNGKRFVKTKSARK